MGAICPRIRNSLEVTSGKRLINGGLACFVADLPGYPPLQNPLQSGRGEVNSHPLGLALPSESIIGPILGVVLEGSAEPAGFGPRENSFSGTAKSCPAKMRTQDFLAAGACFRHIIELLPQGAPTPGNVPKFHKQAKDGGGFKNRTRCGGIAHGCGPFIRAPDGMAASVPALDLPQFS